jgi:hypothetical protein
MRDSSTPPCLCIMLREGRMDGIGWTQPIPMARLVIEGNKFWPSEVRDMTPWVVKHLGMIGAELGLVLHYIGREAPVGNFRADILAEDDTGKRVVIENQFGPTDHDHFAKVVLYACEKEADVVIWISAGATWRRMEPVRPEHVRALKKLNLVFGGTVKFYALAITFSSNMALTEKEQGPIRPRMKAQVLP